MSVAVKVSPSPGFCVKSTSLQSGIYTASAPDPNDAEKRILKKIPVPQGLKIFVNVAWSRDVPPPPEGSEEAIQRAMEGQDIDELNPDGWFVPVIVSDGRQDADKAGKPSLVFDSIFHSSLKSRALKNPEFKTFLIELALQRIEAQSSLQLSRTLGTPNIASKGPLPPRTVSIPTTLFPAGHAQHVAPAKKLIEEVQPAPPKSILKSEAPLETPAWTWAHDGARIQLTIQVPKLTRADLPSAVLDLEPRRITLHVPRLYALDVDLDLPDAALAKALALEGAGPHGTEQGLMLKRARDLDVDGARAEWRVAEGRLVLYA
ncbi:hypothetical protein BV25DRAFT_1802318 [Artomyces pyxidatus]|uniref:Uncharacterized protein n=1 Tax=Artomyces pyxidatus TaxID=48021 RepID=A0ACB8T590_9AGAM|nr:hypothetical protein BV25DRAFT_1802318 [Artomyces pyxidatus]